MRKKLVALALLAFIVFLPLSWFTSSGKIFWARAIIALGSPGARRWAFQQVEGFGVDAGPAVADLIMAPDFLPLSSDGRSLTPSTVNEAVLDWVTQHGRRSPEVGAALILLVADRWRQQDAPELDLNLKNQARFLDPETTTLLAKTALPGTTILRALRSSDPYRRAAGLLVMLFKRVDFPRGRSMEEPRAEVRAALIAIAGRDPKPLVAGMALAILYQDCFFDPPAEAMERYVQAADSALAGPLKSCDPQDIADFYQVFLRPLPEPRRWRETLKGLVDDEHRGRALQAALVLSRYPTLERAPVRGALLRAFEPDGSPVERFLALRGLRRTRGPAAEVLRALLGAFSMEELQEIRDVRARGSQAIEDSGLGPLIQEVDSEMGFYLNQPGARAAILESEDQELRAKARIYERR